MTTRVWLLLIITESIQNDSLKVLDSLQLFHLPISFLPIHWRYFFQTHSSAFMLTAYSTFKVLCTCLSFVIMLHGNFHFALSEHKAGILLSIYWRNRYLPNTQWAEWEIECLEWRAHNLRTLKCVHKSEFNLQHMHNKYMNVT